MPRLKPPDLGHLAQPGAEFEVHATPGARRPSITVDGATLRIAVTDPPEGGRANVAVRKALAAALGVAPTRLALVRGARSRRKLFRLD